MLTTWNEERVAQLAGSAREWQQAERLALPLKWDDTGRSGTIIWATFRRAVGAGVPVAMDLVGARFACRCPESTLPCRHALALLLLFVRRAALFRPSVPPPHVTGWLIDQTASVTPEAPGSFSSRAEYDAAAERRQASAVAGMAALALWLEDLVRDGLGSLPERPFSFWDDMARRLEDTGAPGAARRVRRLGHGVLLAGAQWPQRLLVDLSRLHLVTRAFARWSALSPELQADARAAIGWAPHALLLTDAPPLIDTWLVLGGTAERLILWGVSRDRPAIISMPGEPPAPGAYLHGALRFFPGSAPLRAWPDPLQAVGAGPHRPVGDAALVAATGRYAAALGAVPWLRRWPLFLTHVLLSRSGEQWRIHDLAQRVAPLSARGDQGWRLHALAGGRPFDLLAYWNGVHLTPVSARQGREWLALAAPEVRDDERLV